MKVVEVRRHAERQVPGEELTPKGKKEANLLAAFIPGFDTAYSSPLARATNTVTAMGSRLAVTDSTWGTEKDLGSEVRPPAPFREYRQAIAQGGVAAMIGQRLRESVFRIARALPDGGRALVVTHGGYPELLAAALAPDDPMLEEEPECGYLEGVRIELDGEHFACLKVVRELRV